MVASSLLRLNNLTVQCILNGWVNQYLCSFITILRCKLYNRNVIDICFRTVLNEKALGCFVASKGFDERFYGFSK